MKKSNWRIVKKTFGFCLGVFLFAGTWYMITDFPSERGIDLAGFVWACIFMGICGATYPGWDK